MTTPPVDYEALFAVSPNACLVLDPNLVVRDVNDAYLNLLRLRREHLLGKYILDALPEDRTDPDSMVELRASLDRVLALGRRDIKAPTRYGRPPDARTPTRMPRWYASNTPVLRADGSVAEILLQMEEVTDLGPRDLSGSDDPHDQREAQVARLYARTRAAETLNAELQRSSTEDRRIAITLQEAMLHSPDLPRQHVAVRYLPATGSLNVCGDWYDITELAGGRYAAAVGDVVGHGLEAAAVMGMLRSALNAAMRATDSPGEALHILGMYASSVSGALNATAVKVLVDSGAGVVTYSSAGHLPPVLRHADGSCELLDAATDPPLAAGSEEEPRMESAVSYEPGDTLVLYTDGLVERRGEDIDAGLGRLADLLSHRGVVGPEEMADMLLERLGVSGGARDDVALVVLGL